MSRQKNLQPGTGCTCNCCSGISVQTPGSEVNPPGLSAIAYRTGIWSTFKASMLARLSSSDYPALAGLKTRADDDYSIALLDASSVMLDILTFYQERLANESYLRTATQLDSLTQLSHLIGYRPSPGVSASTYLAFILSSAPGLPTDPTTQAITIPTGTTVQSVPAQGQTPQSFETSGPILAKPDWNALPVQTGEPWQPINEKTSVYLAGTSTQLNPGDAFLVVGEERMNDSASQQWDVRIVSTVVPDTVNRRTLITWLEPLGSHHTRAAAQAPKFFALRQKAAIFGYNAINPALLSKDAITALGGLVDSTPEWVFGKDRITGKMLGAELVIDLDNVYPKVVPGGWLVLINQDGESSRTPAGWVHLFSIASASSTTRTDYGLNSKITRIQAAKGTSTAGTNNIISLLEFYNEIPRSTAALTQSEELTIDEEPLDHGLHGTYLDLAVVRQDLVGITAVAIIGKRQKIAVNAGVTTLTFTPDDTTTPLSIAPGDILTLLQPPTLHKKGDAIPGWSNSSENLTLFVADSSGRSGTVSAALNQFTLTLASANDPVAQEFALVASVQIESKPFARTRIVLKRPLLNCYDRTMTCVNANVGAATGGASVTEILGSGSAATLNQKFTLKQKPLTYIQAATPSGSLSTLEVTVNGAAWTEEPTLYAQPSSAQVFEVINLTSGTAVVEFGDGDEGATLPTGQNNFIANYRVGNGAAGNVAGGSITTLVDRPVGVSGVTNPSPATGGQDPQTVDGIRRYAPLSVQTLGRAVSITDYQNFASTFAGIAKAYALWIPNGVNRGVFLTVAGANGASLTGSLTLTNLVNALRSYGTPNIAIHAQSFYETVFRLSASIAYDPAYDPDAVNAAILTLLTSTYSFANRTFGQGVSSDEIAALLQGVSGVVAVNVTRVKAIATSAAGDLGGAAFSVSAWNNWIAQTKKIHRPHFDRNRICPYIPMAASGALPDPAEIIVLDPNPKAVVLEVMA